MSTTLEKWLPDFDDMSKIVEELRNLDMRRASLEFQIKKGEMIAFTVATEDSQYFVGNKPPSATYINSKWKYGGINNELLPLRKELGELEVEIDNTKLKLEILRMKIEVWRTVSANERLSRL